MTEFQDKNIERYRRELKEARLDLLYLYQHQAADTQAIRDAEANCGILLGRIAEAEGA